MLEQAIIDAAALRETAMKNAEASLIEKYSKEFKDTVEKLLEQEMQPADAAANAADPTGPTVAPAADPAIAAMPAAQPAIPEPGKKDVFAKVKSAFFDIEGDDSELITINFDGLKAKPVQTTPSDISMPPATAPEMPAALEESIELELDEAYGQHGGADSYHGSTAGEEEQEEELDEWEHEEELDESDTYEEEELELELDESAASLAMKKDASKLKTQAAQREAAASEIEAKDAEDQEKAAEASEKVEETIELSEDELAELEEALRVDMNNEPEGYMGSTKRKQREFKAVAFAKARDDKKAEKREKMEKTLSDLQESLQSISSNLSEEKELNATLLETVEQLKQQIEKTNLSNAKLLYTNKALCNVSLNERQKTQIVENIAKADSVLEAKTIYETLQSAVVSKTESAPKSLSEAINRGSTPFLARPKQPASINDLMAERMKLLAGIHSKN